MGIGERIKEMRMQKKITQSELADRLGVPYQSIGQWERSVRNPKIETLQKIAEALDVDINWLMHGKTLEQRDQAMKDYVARRFKSIETHPDGIIRVPVYGVIPAGIPMSAIEEVLDYEEMPSGRDTVGKEFFALKIKGDSMFPNYIDGDVVIFQKQDVCDSGKDCAVMVNGDDATFKRIERKANGVMLKPLNPAYETMFFTNEEIEAKPVRILGVAIEIRRKL